jgi:putative endonuclease
MQQFRQYFVYILASKKNGTHYIRVTNNIERRIEEHKNKVTPNCFTAKYAIDLSVYYEIFQYINDAIDREKQLKKWNRQWKINLIEEENKDWKDLSEEWSN